MDENLNNVENVVPEENNSVDEKVQEPEILNNSVDTDNAAADDYVKEEAQECDVNDDDFDSSSFSNTERYTAPYVNISPVIQPDPVDKKGLRIFALILAAVILLSCGTATGYYFGKNNIFGGKVTTSDLASKPEDTDMYTTAQVYEAVNDSIVGIMVYNSSAISSASGVIYTESGYIITNDHIYDGIGAAKFKVYTADGHEYAADYVAGDTRSDIAVLKITDSVKLKPAPFGNSDELYVGEPVVAMGRPTGATTANNITGGIVSLLNSRASVTSNYSTKYIQTNAAINPGSSGGALLNMYGQVVGITSSKIAGENYEGMGFAIPTTTAKKVADSLIEHEYVVDRSRLGISYREINSATAEAYQMTKGLYIAAIESDSDLLGKADVGDTIIAVNGNNIVDSTTILDVIENSVPGTVITFTISNEDGTKDVSAKLIPDKGSSSYESSESSSYQNGSNQNSSEFSFPFGD